MRAADADDLREVPIAELRRRVDVGLDVDQLEIWAAKLGADGRAGVRALAQRCTRRAARMRAEADRIARLFERRARLTAKGRRFVAGVDEVGVGPLAGPVVAAAVILPASVDLPGLNDSKKLSKAARERLSTAIRCQAIAFAIGEVEPRQIDELNILRASLEAMRRAVEQLSPQPDHLLVDARTIPRTSIPQTPIPHGDAEDGSIAAASIVAKVHRDALMAELDTAHPGYGFARHKGYPTADHIDALAALGPSPVHRHSFAPVAAAARR